MSRVARHSTPPRALPIVAAFLTIAVTAFYWYLISAQGGDDGPRPRLIGAALLIVSLALIASTVAGSAAVRLALLSLGSFTLVIWAVVGAMSIGILLFPAAVLSLRAAGKATSPLAAATAWAAVTSGVAGALLLAWLAFGSS